MSLKQVNLHQTTFFKEQHSASAVGLDGAPLPLDGADDELELCAGPGCGKL